MGLFGSAVPSDVVVPDGIRNGAKRRGEELTGLFLLAMGLFIAVSLATWSVTDPSFNHASDTNPQNLLGYPGAVIADFLIQIFGLAAIVLVLPVLVWGWQYLSHKPLNQFKNRLVCGWIALITAAVFASTLPTSASWPLPTGLGGFLGDKLRLAPFALLGLGESGFTKFFMGALAAAAALFSLFFAINASIGDLIHSFSDKDGLDDPLSQDKRANQEIAEEDDSDDDRAYLGAVSHLILASKARVRKMLGLKSARKPVVEHSTNISYPMNEDIPVSQQSADDKEVDGGFLGSLGLFGKSDDDIGLDDDNRIEPSFGSEYAQTNYYEQVPMRPVGNEQNHVPQQAPAAPPPQNNASAGPVNVEAQTMSLKQGERVNSESKQNWFRPRHNYVLPPLKLLGEAQKEKRNPAMSREVLENNARMLEGVLEDFGVKGQIINVRPGPVVTMYELEPAPGIKSSRVIGLADDVARSMSAISARIAVVPGRNAIGIELPNVNREVVHLREILSSQEYEQSSAKLPLTLGKTIGGEPVITDLARMPHLLIAGTTGSGKSVGINAMILSLLYRLPPDQCKLIMIDPKMLELSVYDSIPHLLAPVVTDPKKAVMALKWTVREMEERYKKMSKLGVRNIDGYNQRVKEAADSGESISRMVQTGFDRETGQAVYETEEMDLQKMPYLVVIVDEMADLMMVAGKDIEGAIQRLAQMARAAGIHLVMATQRPSVDVITGTIKANFPTRISFQVTSKIDSRTILGEQGAEQLLGQGDMLYMAGGGRISRVHGPFISDSNVEAVVNHLRSQGAPEYLEAVTLDDENNDSGPVDPIAAAYGGGDDGDDLYQRAIQIVMTDKKASTSYIQRRLSIGYNRAATLIERMENDGIISAANHAGKREILMGNDEEPH